MSTRIAGVIMVNDQGNILLNYVAPEMNFVALAKPCLLKLFETCHTKNILQIDLRKYTDRIAVLPKISLRTHSAFQ